MYVSDSYHADDGGDVIEGPDSALRDLVLLSSLGLTCSYLDQNPIQIRKLKHVLFYKMIISYVIIPWSKATHPLSRRSELHTHQVPEE